jgi:hypothetical protein
MTDVLDNIFVRIEDKFNGMENKKLKELNQQAEKIWADARELDKERVILLKKILPKHHQELQKAKKERDFAKEEIRIKILQLKEDRNNINKEFLNKTRYIKDERRELIAKDKILSKNLEERRKAWDDSQKAWKEYHNYYEQLNKKYRKADEGVKQND